METLACNHCSRQLEPGKARACGNDPACNAIYCGEECADAHWYGRDKHFEFCGAKSKWIQKSREHMKKGAFGRQAKSHDESPRKFEHDVLEHPGKYSTTTRRRAQWMKNVSGK